MPIGAIAIGHADPEAVQVLSSAQPIARKSLDRLVHRSGR